MRGCILTLALFGLVPSLPAQEKTDDNPRRILQDHLLSQAKVHFDARRQTVANLKTPSDIRKYQEALRAKFLEAIGPMPEKTPLNGRVVGTLQGDGFRVEKVIYESRPNHHITANLYLPDVKGSVPGVLVPCGHSTNGKAAEAYQRVCILMAKNGLAAMCFDPIGQGERYQLLKDDGKPGIPSSTNEHTHVGVGAWLVGQGCASYRIWDGIRSLDYLASRPEIDPKRLGCAGNSGGGTMTSYLMALDDRIAAAVPSCYLTTLEKLFTTIGPQDAEQNIVGQVAIGLEHADFITLRAPKPTLMAVATQDFFNIDGSWTTFREASGIFGKLGQGERVALFEFDDKHGFSRPRREATMRWMRRWLLGIDDAPMEGSFPAFKDAELQCTRSGQVLADLKGVSAFQLSVQYAEQAKATREKFVALSIDKQKDGIRRVLGLGKESSSAALRRVAKEIREGGIPVIVDREKGVALHGTIILASEPDTDTLVLVLPENRPTNQIDPLTKTYVTKKSEVLEFDLRGLGGLPVNAKPAFFSHDFKSAMLGLHLNRPLLSQRVDDVLAIVNVLEKDGKGRKIHLVGQGLTGPIALHAAALDSRIAMVTVEAGLGAWENVVRTPESVNQLSNVVPGVLGVYDLPQLAATLAPRPLTFRGTTDAQLKTMTPAAVESMYQACREAYDRVGAGKQFRVE